MIQANINGRPFFALKEISILEACKFIGIKIPRFCYHENLSIAGNCRMCLVEVAKVPKPVASCAVLIEDNMIIHTEGPFILKARANVLEALLLNHPLDCPICDQGGECDLQDQSKMYGNNVSRNFFNKRGVEDKYCGPLIKTIMTRCIHCTRCVRFTNEICGVKILGTLNRGNNVEISNYIGKVQFSGILANVVDLCPVGALTFKPSSFQIRSWEVKSLESIDLTDGLGSNLYINYKELDIIRVLPKKNIKLNESWLSDKARFSINNFIHQNSFNNLELFISKNCFPKRLLFLINHEISLETLNFLQHLSFISKGSIQLKNIGQVPVRSNIYFWSSYSKVQNISLFNTVNQVVLFLSSNLNVESTLLNIRIRTKFFSYKTNIYSFGNFFKSTFPISFLKLNIQSLLKLFSGKDFLLTRFFLNNKVFLFYGKSLISRLDSKIINFLRNKIPTLFCYKINTYCNTEGVNYLNIHSYGFQDFKNSDSIFSLFLDDNISFRKKKLHFGFKLTEFHHFTSKSLFHVNHFLLLNNINKEGIYLNLEQRPQKASKLINFFVYNKSLNYFLDVLKEYYILHSFNSFFIKENRLVTRKSLLNLFTEILSFPELFNKTVSFLDNSKLLKLSSINFFSKYPLKLIIHDVFRTNTLSKNSITLLKCSQEMRNQEQNF
jgi:NADH-quinone oxidoreductase subunit G